MLRTHQVPPKGDSSHPRKSEFSSIYAGPGRNLEDSETTAARQTERNDLSAARAKAPKERISQRKSLGNSATTPSPPSLIVQPGSGTGAALPEGEAAQGPSPSPIDYSAEVEVDFPKDLVSAMKENAAKKARRTVIGRTLGGRATLKTLFDCLKLHLPIPFVSITLLTRGYFEVQFEEEEGAKATRRLATIEWSGLSLSFSRYTPNFDASSQGAKAQLTQAIKV
jgi:chemotaxis response regulator CheB